MVSKDCSQVFKGLGTDHFFWGGYGGRGLGNFHRTFCFPGPNFVVKKESVTLSYSQSGGEKLKMSAKLCNCLSQELIWSEKMILPCSGAVWWPPKYYYWVWKRTYFSKITLRLSCRIFWLQDFTMRVQFSLVCFAYQIFPLEFSLNHTETSLISNHFNLPVNACWTCIQLN